MIMRLKVNYINYITAFLYIILYRCIYTFYLVPTWGYMGYRVNIVNDSRILITDIITFLPILFYQSRKKVSDYISIILYIFVYVPSIISLQLYYLNYTSIISYQVVFMLSMVLFFVSGRNRYSQHTYKTKNNMIALKYHLIAGIIIVSIVVFSYGSHLRFVSFYDVYSLRSDNQSISTNNPLLGYLELWTANYFSPLFTTIGLYKRKIGLTIIGISMGCIIYAATGLKSSIMTPIITIFFYYIFSNIKNMHMKYFFPTIILGFLFLYILSKSVSNDILYIATSVIFMRTIGIAGLLTPAYIEVFNHNPYTYYSHVGLVNLITKMYPYKESLGIAVWSKYSGESPDNSMNANANFLLTDGVAAAGITGIILISILFYFLLVYLNKLSNRHNINVVFALLTGSLFSLTNVSLFTTLLSSGLLLCICLLRYTTFEPNSKLKF